jgi:hypothetical protein
LDSGHLLSLHISHKAPCTLPRAYTQEQTLLNGQAHSSSQEVKCAQDASDVRESHLQEDMRSALQTIGAKLFNKGKDDQLTARIPKCSKDDLEVCVREGVILVTIPNFRTLPCLLSHYNICGLQLFRFPEKVSCNSCLQRLLDTYNQGAS